MHYTVDEDDLVIRIPLDALAEVVKLHHSDIVKAVRSKPSLAMSVGRELCECVDIGEEYYLSRVLDDALERVVTSDDPALEYK